MTSIFTLIDECGDIIGYFSTPEKAEAAVHPNVRDSGVLRIEEIQLDTLGLDSVRGMFFVEVYLDTGEPWDAPTTTTCTWRSAPWDDRAEIYTTFSGNRGVVHATSYESMEAAQALAEKARLEYLAGDRSKVCLVG